MAAITESEFNLFKDPIQSYDEIKSLSDIANSSEINQINFAKEAQKAGEEGKTLEAGLGYYILGDSKKAIELLEKAKDSEYKFVFLAKAYKKAGNYDKSIECLDKAASQKADTLMVALEKTDALRLAGKFEDAQKEIDNCGNYEKVSAEYHFQLAKLSNSLGQYQQALDNFETAIEIDPNHEDAMFQLACLLDLHGDDDAAFDYYTQLAQRTPVKVNVLFNLAVLCEDCGDWHKAYDCIAMINKYFPNNARARMYSKDIASSMTMLVDEEREKQKDKRNKVLEIPISDFELSVRSRNCLRKMNIYTLGDLLKINESELLSYKNFGETSLTEIRNILESKGLRLGMSLDEELTQENSVSEDNSEEDNENLARSVEELELSVRAKRALDRLNIRSLGELVSKTEAELLGCKNFGITSLTEIKEKLTKFGMGLRKLD